VVSSPQSTHWLSSVALPPRGKNGKATDCNSGSRYTFGSDFRTEKYVRASKCFATDIGRFNVPIS